MDLKAAYIILLLSFIEPSFIDTLACNKMCSGTSNNELSCYVQSTGCDVVFPTRVFSMADPGYYWTFVNFTKNLRGSSSNISFESRGKFWYRDEYLFQRYTFRIDYIKRDNDGNIVSAELAFVIRNTVAQDSGVYDVVLKEGSYKHARTVALHQKYRLFNTHSPSPKPVCSAVDTASLPLDVDADYLLYCTVLGYFYPKIEVKIVSSSGECPYQIINKTKASLLPEMTLEHAYVTYCETTSFTCVVSQNRVTYDNEVYSCAFQLERPKNATISESSGPKESSPTEIIGLPRTSKITQTSDKTENDNGGTSLWIVIVVDVVILFLVLGFVGLLWYRSRRQGGGVAHPDKVENNGTDVRGNQLVNHHGDVNDEMVYNGDPKYYSIKDGEVKIPTYALPDQEMFNNPDSYETVDKKATTQSKEDLESDHLNHFQHTNKSFEQIDKNKEIVANANGNMIDEASMREDNEYSRKIFT
ncbi:uncharacterized protein [Apostichopus japonicus]|uniref:uncharacterized protein n=1 Tax=Stichopus japonicus TaxID=307972 RepID=UPI003AB625D6